MIRFNLFGLLSMNHNHNHVGDGVKVRITTTFYFFCFFFPRFFLFFDSNLVQATSSFSHSVSPPTPSVQVRLRYRACNNKVSKVRSTLRVLR